jgi:hypothetical protein
LRLYFDYSGTVTEKQNETPNPVESEILIFRLFAILFRVFRVLYAKAVLKFAKLNTVAQQREAVIRGRSLLPYRLRYIFNYFLLR